MQDERREATAIQKDACRSMGTNQCAALCLSNLTSHRIGDCAMAAEVWTDKAIAAEARRRPTGPLAAYATGAPAARYDLLGEPEKGLA